MKKIILLLATIVSSTLSFSQIEYTNAPPFDAEMFAERLAGYGVEIFNAELTCGDSSSGYFWNGGTTNLGMESGIVLTTGTTEIAFSPNTVGGASGLGGAGSYLLEDFLASNLICFVSTFNACILEFDFIAYGDEISLNYIFGSEEYPEYIGSSISDIFMILIEGLPQYPPEMSMMERNIGTIPSIPDIYVSINTLNFGTFPHFYQDNTGDEYIQYDGQTVRLPANATVTPGNTYHLTFVIADVADAIFDSGLFLEENSFQSNIPLLQSIRSDIAENSQRVAENCSEGILTFSLPFAPLYEEVWLPILTQVSDAPRMQMIFGGTATLQEDYTTDVSGISFSKREKDDLFPEIPTQEIRIIPIADNIEEETEYITVGLYSPYTESYLSMDTIWLEDEFNASIIEDVDICEANTEVSLWASGGTEYHWFPKDYLDCSDCPNPIATVPHSMTYFVNIEKMGCTEQELVNITIDENLNSAFLEEEVRVCSTESIELKASGGLYYEWEGVGAASTNELSCIDCPNPIFSPSTSMGDYIYSVRISSGEEGCEKVLTTNINVENTVLDLSVNQTSICSGETVVLTVVGNAENYLWQDGEGVIIAVSESIEVSPQTNETYIVSTQGTSCVISDSIHLEVCQLEAQIEVSDSFICKGESVLLNAIGTGEHTWLDSENNVIETGNELSVTPDMNTLYQLVAIQNGFIDTASTFISVEPTINLQVFPENPIICNSEERILLSIVNPIQGLTYEWEESEDLQVIWSNGQRAYASPNIDKTYTVQAISPAGCILSKEVTVSVGGELEITVDAPKVVCVDLDGPTLYTIRAYGANSYLWTPIGPLLPGSESYEAIFIPTAFNNDATFRVTGTNQDGTCTGFTEFEIEVVDKPEVLVDVTGICEDETTQIEVSVEGGSGSFEYEWYPVVGLSNPKGHITTAIIEEDGTSMYSLTIRDVELDYEWTEYVYANISKVKVLSPKFFKICGEEEELEFKVYGGYGATYTWMDANGNVFPNTNEELTVISPESGVYTVEVETSKGCNKSIDFEVEVLPNPSIEVIGLPDVVCSGEVFTLEVTGAEVYVLKSENNVPFDHQFISSNTIEVIVYEDTDLQITGISSFACEIDRTIHIDVLDIKVLTPFEVAICGEGDTAVLEVDGGEEAIYEWTSDVFLPNPNESAMEVNASMLGLYTVSVKTIGGCEELIGFDVILRELPDVNASMDFVEACKGDTVRLQLSGALSYEFVENNEQPFELSYLSDNEVEIIVSNDLDFSIIGTNGFGCTGIFDVKIDQISEPASVEYGGVICFGDSVELSADGGEGASYSWTPMAAFDNSNISNPIVSPTESVVYTVLITDKNGCESTHTVVVVVGVEVTADLAATPNEMCEPKPTVLSVEGSLFSEYIFYDETGAVVAENNTGQAVVIPPNTTTYTVVVTNADGCTAMDEVTVTVQDMSIYLAENFIVCEDEKLTLKPIVNAPDLSYEWTPNTGIDHSNTLNPIVSISETTAYTLTTTSDLGCTSSIQTTLEVAEDCVYPGDADDNGKVNMFDLFAIGLHFDKSGFARNTISNKWQGFGCYDWSETQENGKNLKYVDSNGNGTIGFEDTVALVYNFDLHQKSGGFTKGSLGDPELQFVPNFETIGPDETLEFEVWLGSDTNPVSNLYAIAFETFFDTNLIDGNSISMDYTNSSLGTLGESLLATGWINEANGRINVSLSKIDGSGVSGKVYLLSIRMRTQDIFAASNFSFNITDFGATNSNGTEVLVNVDETPSIRIDPNVVGIEENTVLTKPYTLHPSFTQNGFYISYQSHKTPLVEVTLFDLSGQKLDIWSLQRKSNSGVFKTYIDLKEKGLAAGLYLVELKVEGNIYQEKVVFY